MMHVKEMFEITRKTPHMQIAICTNSFGGRFRFGQFVLVNEKNGVYTIAGTPFSAEKFNNYFEVIYDEDDISDSDLIDSINMSTIFGGFRDVEEFKVDFKINNFKCSINFGQTLYDVKYNDPYDEYHEVTFGSPFEVINFLQETYNKGLASNIIGYTGNYNPDTGKFEIIEKDGLHPYDLSTWPEGNTSSIFKKFYADKDEPEAIVEFLNAHLVKSWEEAIDRHKDTKPVTRTMYPKVCSCGECGKFFIEWKHIEAIRQGEKDRTRCLDCINKISAEQKAVWREHEAVMVDYFGGENK